MLYLTPTYTSSFSTNNGANLKCVCILGDNISTLCTIVYNNKACYGHPQIGCLWLALCVYIHI